MQDFKAMYHRVATHDVRFAMPALVGRMGADARRRDVRARWTAACLAAGATCIGGGWVNNGRKGRGTMKDRVYSVPVQGWQGFVARLEAELAKAQAAEPGHKQEPRLTLAERVARLEAYVAGLANTDSQ
jgi:hypothetical protein